MKKPDILQGPLTKSMFSFALPLMLSTILQDFFAVADKAVLGNMAGSVAVASVAATGTVSSLIINGAIGLATGTAIVLARFLGQRDLEKIRSTVDTSIVTGLIFGLIVAAAGIFLAPVFLTATKCPAECYEGALIYMRIVLAAAPATLLYNFGAAVLRAIGDTQKTLNYITVAGVVNVALNILLCLVLPQKVIAVAVATVASKVISATLVLRRLCTIESSVRVNISRIRFDLPSFGRIVRFGVPSSISNLVLPLGNIQIATAINSFGAEAVAGHSAAASVESFVHAVSLGFGSTVMTFVGQNVGAKNVARVKKSFWLCLLYNFLITGTLGVLACLTGEFWIGIVVGRSAEAAIAYGMVRMRHVAMFMFVNAVSVVLTRTMNAFGYPIFTSITNIIINLGFRVLWMQFVYPISPKFETIMLCYTVAWILNLSFYVVAMLIVYRRYFVKGICKRI